MLKRDERSIFHQQQHSLGKNTIPQKTQNNDRGLRNVIAIRKTKKRSME